MAHFRKRAEELIGRDVEKMMTDEDFKALVSRIEKALLDTYNEGKLDAQAAGIGIDRQPPGKRSYPAAHLRADFEDAAGIGEGVPPDANGQLRGYD